MIERIVQETSLRYCRNSWGGGLVGKDTVLRGRRGIDPCPSRGLPARSARRRSAGEWLKATRPGAACQTSSSMQATQGDRRPPYGHARSTSQVARTTKPSAGTESSCKSGGAWSAGKKGRSATDSVTRCEAGPDDLVVRAARSKADELPVHGTAGWQFDLGGHA